MKKTIFEKQYAYFASEKNFRKLEIPHISLTKKSVSCLSNLTTPFNTFAGSLIEWCYINLFSSHISSVKSILISYWILIYSKDGQDTHWKCELNCFIDSSQIKEFRLHLFGVCTSKIKSNERKYDKKNIYHQIRNKNLSSNAESSFRKLTLCKMKTGSLCTLMKQISPSLHFKAKTGVVAEKINTSTNVIFIQVTDQLLPRYPKTKESSS